MSNETLEDAVRDPNEDDLRIAEEKVLPRHVTVDENSACAGSYQPPIDVRIETLEPVLTSKHVTCNCLGECKERFTFDLPEQRWRTYSGIDQNMGLDLL